MAVVKVVCKNLKQNPHCPHGPTLKFVRMQNGLKQEFFACSTFRQRKDCGFYLDVGNKLTEQTQKAWSLEKKKVLPYVDHDMMEARLIEVKKESPKDRLYCHTCNQLDLVSRRKQHNTHTVQTFISNSSLAHPSQILKPKESSKMEAQYLFSNSTVQVIVDNLCNAGVSRVLCLGTPRVHEHIQAGSHQESLLLDLDNRYYSFWPSGRFIWYNMFNRYILSTQKDMAKCVLQEFLSVDGRIALVMDPPFGGHVEPLAATIKYFKRIVAKNKKKSELLVIWIFPYFRERHITEKCPSLTMLDYKVQYDNHKHFNNGSKGRKLGSPVRLFTDMNAKHFVLPESEGYQFCTICARWVAPENKHCGKCKSCPSKDGRTYVHCDACGSCVKPQWHHCDTCNRCLPSGHLCSSLVKETLKDQNTWPRHKKMKTIKMKSNTQEWKKRNKKLY